MAGLYFHIPFCENKCAYCNFYSLASMKHYADFVKSLLSEINLKKHLLINSKIESIYFGGGTPSLLKIDDLQAIFDTLETYIDISKVKEITLECNPDHINNDYVRQLKSTAINRISLGIQSFQDEDLIFLERKHRDNQAKLSIDILQDNGFQNISADLIFGLPAQKHSLLEENIHYLIEKNIPHISAYALTLEERTIYDHHVKKGTKLAPDEKLTEEYFYLIDRILTKNNYQHYEISNYALKGKESIHNSNYWTGKNYFSFGPGAHSYDGKKRYWNISNVVQYIEKITTGIIPESFEILSAEDKINEYILIHIRTQKGIDLREFEQFFGIEQHRFLRQKAQEFIKKEMLFIQDHFLKANLYGMLFSDLISRELMI